LFLGRSLAVSHFASGDFDHALCPLVHVTRAFGLSGVLAAFILFQPITRLMLNPGDSLCPFAESINLRLTPVWGRDAYIPALSAFQAEWLESQFWAGGSHYVIMRPVAPEDQSEIRRLN
jgi:hypothetical protein